MGYAMVMQEEHMLAIDQLAVTASAVGSELTSMHCLSAVRNVSNEHG